jgi:hypothetical protein
VTANIGTSTTFTDDFVTYLINQTALFAPIRTSLENLPLVNLTTTQPETLVGSIVYSVNGVNAFGASGVTVGSIPSLPAGTNRIGVVTIGAGTVTIGAGTAQIGSVTVGNSVTIGSLPAISGTVTANNPNLSSNNDAGGQPVLRTGVYAYDYAEEHQVGVAIVDSAPGGPALNISGTVNTFAVQGTAVTTSNFTSTTASTVLANYNATREVLTIFNEGAGNLHVCVGATCTTIAYQVRLSAGDYYEVPNHQTTITHSAVFATAGTARVTEVS